jgi:hypothetical protein
MIKDNKSGGVINTDKEALLKYKRDKMIERKLDALSAHVAELKNSLSNVSKRLELLEIE